MAIDRVPGGDDAHKRPQYLAGESHGGVKPPPVESSLLKWGVLSEVDQRAKEERKLGFLEREHAYALILQKGSEFLQAGLRGDDETLAGLIQQGMPVNLRYPRSNQTVLHALAARGARPALRVLLKAKRLDFLARDGIGRLASELANIYGDDPAMGRLLLRKEAETARARGIVLKRREQPSTL